MPELDAEWESWVSTNVEAGCDPQELLSILIDKGFDERLAMSTILEACRAAEADEGARPVATPRPGVEDAAAEDALDAPADFGMEKLAPFVWRLDDVLDDDDCAVVINAARSRLQPSTVVVDASRFGDEGSGVSDVRTGSSASFGHDEVLLPRLSQVIARLRELVALLTNLPASHQEPIEILHYAEGQHFDRHFDSFAPGTAFLDWEGERGGQRLFTLSLYLNDVAAGGEMEFPNLGLSLQPTTGTGLFWHNVLDGAVYHGSEHRAGPVEQGEKWVLTIWVRESPFGRPTPARRAIQEWGEGRGASWLNARFSLDRPSWLDAATRDQQERVPYLGAGGSSSRGFERRDLPEPIFGEILEQYEKAKPALGVETDACVGSVLHSANPAYPPSLFAEDLAFNERMLERLRPMHEEWCGFALAPSCIYGFRVYLPGAFLYDHVDREQTHVISTTICVDQHLWSPWPFHAIDEDQKEHALFLQPGECLLYESARIEHGRPVPLNGQFQVSLFVHYHPAEDAELWASAPHEWAARHRPGRTAR